MNNPLHKLKKLTEDLYSGMTSTLKESKFYEEGVLTPEEFIEAGNFLISKCPTWKWCAAEEKLYDKRLPKDKQYLKTNVPSYKRCSEYLKSNATTETVVEGDWIDADLENKPKDDKKPTALNLDIEEKKKEIVAKNTDDDDDDFVIEGEDDDKNENVEEENKDKQEAQVDVVKTRTYDVTVTYDFYYRVPRMWLMGYNVDFP